jgi:Tfp pilus assembly protein PilN
MRHDINLIPKRSSVISAKTMFFIILITISGIIITGLYGLYLPLKTKNELKNLIKEKQEELLLYGGVYETFNTLTDQINSIITIKAAFEALKINNLKMTQILQDFQDNIPKNMVIQNISYSNSNGELLMEGLSPTYKEIAQYIVKLRQLDYILDVGFTSAELEKDEMNADSSKVTDSEADVAMHKFKIIVSLKTSGSITSATGLPESNTTDEKGGQ